MRCGGGEPIAPGGDGVGAAAHMRTSHGKGARREKSLGWQRPDYPIDDVKEGRVNVRGEKS